jgi:Protein of unknown function (DUF2970)
LKAWRAVFWSFFGVRRDSDLEADADRLTPIQVILAGLLGALLLVLALVGVVYLVTR